MTGAEFREIRERLRLNQTDLAWLMGTIQTTVSRWEGQEYVPTSAAAFMRVLDAVSEMGISALMLISKLGGEPREKYSRR